MSSGFDPVFQSKAVTPEANNHKRFADMCGIEVNVDDIIPTGQIVYYRGSIQQAHGYYTVSSQVWNLNDESFHYGLTPIEGRPTEGFSALWFPSQPLANAKRSSLTEDHMADPFHGKSHYLPCSWCGEKWEDMTLSHKADCAYINSDDEG